MASNTRGASFTVLGDSANAAPGADASNAPIAPTVIKYFGQFWWSLCPNLFLLFLVFAFFFDLSLISV
jgi:hypothetical protein